MNGTRLVGIALAVVGLIVMLIAHSLAYQIGLYLGKLVILTGCVIYTVGVLKVPQKHE
jgi:hypothetical protein